MITTASDRYIIETYREYVGLKLHFNGTKFNYKDPNQLTRLKVDQLLNRSDHRWFVELANIYRNKPQERFDFLLSQFKHDQNAWIGDFFCNAAYKIHDNRMKIINSFDYYIKSDVESIINKYKDNKSLTQILAVNSDRPMVYKDLNITNEMISILDLLFKFEDNTMNPLWSNTLFSCRRYMHFLPISSKGLADIKNHLEANLIVTSEQEIEENTLDHLFN